MYPADLCRAEQLHLDKILHKWYTIYQFLIFILQLNRTVNRLKIEAMLSDDEKILWEHLQLEQKTLSKSKTNGCLYAVLSIVVFSVFFTIMSVAFGKLLSLIMVAILLPFWLKAKSALTKGMDPYRTRYCMTKKGIYIQKGNAGEEDTEYAGYAKKIRAAVVKNSTDGCADGIMTLSYVNHLEGGEFKEEFVLNGVQDCAYTVGLINEQAEIWKENETMRLEAQQGPSAAEQFREPTALTARKSPYPTKNRDFSMEEIPQIVIEAAASGKTPKKNRPKAVAVKSNKSRWTPKATLTQTGDADRAFFGDIQSLLPMPGKKASFLAKDGTKKKELLAALPDDTVADLQAELFGSEAEQQGAFPDPTVNPLPVLSGVMPQPQFPFYSNPTSPYALPSENAGVWQTDQNQEMDSLEADPALRAWDEINAQTKEKNDQNGQLMQ